MGMARMVQALVARNNLCEHGKYCCVNMCVCYQCSNTGDGIGVGTFLNQGSSKVSCVSMCVSFWTPCQCVGVVRSELMQSLLCAHSVELFYYTYVAPFLVYES